MREPRITLLFVVVYTEKGSAGGLEERYILTCPAVAALRTDRVEISDITRMQQVVLTLCGVLGRGLPNCIGVLPLAG